MKRSSDQMSMLCNFGLAATFIITTLIRIQTTETASISSQKSQSETKQDIENSEKTTINQQQHKQQHRVSRSSSLDDTNVLVSFFIYNILMVKIAKIINQCIS